MFKFLKEIKDAIKEGVQEGIEEARAEAAEEARQETAGEMWRLDNASETEQFGVALGAVYRDVYIGAMRRRDDNDPAVFLMTFDLPEDNLKSYTEVLERDFDISDSATLHSAVETFWRELKNEDDPETGEPSKTGYAACYEALQEHNALSGELPAISDLSAKQLAAVQELENTLGLGPKGGDAFRLGVLSHMICGSCALGYISKPEALTLIDPVVAHARAIYADWNSFSLAFEAGEIAWGGGNFMSRKVMAKTAETLRSHPASPWQQVMWAQGSA